jgi:hypothetical protein
MGVSCKSKSSLALRSVAWRAVARAALISVALFALPTQHLIAEREQAASHSASTLDQQPKPSIPTEADLSRAYMNCQIEVDRSISALVGHTNVKAVRVESQSQRAFCENRKRDCLARRDSSECRTFIAEFERSELIGGGLKKGK